VAEFAHLHVHTEFSLLDGAIPCKKLAQAAAGMGMPAVALTDHNNMFGAIRHYTACEAAGITPILGCEVNVLREGFDPGSHEAPLDHLVLLAENEVGYKNLLRIVSRGHTHPVSPNAPSVTFDTVARGPHGAPGTEGLIGLSACMGGVLAQQYLMHGVEAGRRMLERLATTFTPGSFYVELQDHAMAEQPVLNKLLLDGARDMGLPVVASNDCHFLDRSDGEAQLYLSCIATNRAFADASEQHHGSYEMYLKPPDEMAHLFRDVPEAVKNTLVIAERCQALKLTLGKPMLPTFPVPEGFDTASYLRHVTHEGLTERLAELRALGREPDERVFRERLDMELGIIISMDFPGYFLIVWDFIRYAKEQGIPVGPGRGSGAGSLVAFSLRITDLDPLEHSLLFERFLNPERVSMPDFDIDFCMDRRDEVIGYVARKYGVDSVGQIATFHQLKSRSVIKDVARAMGMPAVESQRIANLIPAKGPGIMYSIPESLEIEPKLKAAMNGDPTINELITQAQRLEGLTRHAGMHAAGVVISEGALWEHVPCFKNDEQVVTQYDKDDVEKAGLVKFDFLGLKTLTVIDIAERLVNQRPDMEGEGPLVMGKVPLDDTKTYELLQSGDTTGVFQLESSGMQQLFRDLRPSSFEDIVAAVALYRPGPLGTGMVKDFVDCKHGRKPIAKMHDLVDEVLKPTYGVIVYQEQVMQIAQRLAGYSLGGADLLRRAMGKKKVEEMAKQKTVFVEGALKKDVTQDDAERIFGLLEYFAGYGFNKCVHGDTRIIDADTGQPTTVQRLFDNRRPMRVHALGPDGRLKKRRVLDVVHNGEKPVFELVTALGHRIVATGTHRFKTFDGYVPLSELSVGDRVAAPRRLPVTGVRAMEPHELIVLAGLIAEGNTCHPTCLYFYSNDEDHVDDFARAVSAFPDTVARVAERGHRREVCVSTGTDTRFAKGSRPGNAPQAEPQTTAGLRSGAFRWAESLGLLGRRAPDKRVPEIVFGLDDDLVAFFVGRLWAGDGFIAGAGGNHVPSYATSSQGLARDVQQLLLRLGITSGVHEKRFKYRGEERPGFTVHVLGDGMVRRFFERIAPHCVGRDDQVALLEGHLASRSDDRSSKDTLPAEVRAWVREAKIRSGMTWGELEATSNHSMREMTGTGSANKRGFRRSTIADIASSLDDSRLAEAASSDVFWDTVVSITPAGVAPTYDLTVEEDHNFVADGLIVHNSHSAAYALLTYQTGWLKAHYPVEFLCALLTADRDKTDKVVRIIAEGRAWGIEILPPEVNESKVDFTVVYDDEAVATLAASHADGNGEAPKRRRRAGQKFYDALGPKIRFGLGAVRGVGESALEAMLEARADGPFDDPFDLAQRVDVRRLNKGVFEALVQCGAFDASLEKRGVSRAEAFASIDRIVERGRSASRDRECGQTNLFGLFQAQAPTGGPENNAAEYARGEPWDLAETLKREKQSLGFYVSGHPLDRYGVELSRFDVVPVKELAAMDPWSRVRVAGTVEGYRERLFKSGDKIAFFVLEDLSGGVEAKVRSKTLARVGEVLSSGEPVMVNGKLQFPMSEDDDGPREPTLLVDEVIYLSDAIRAETRSVAIRLDPERANPGHIQRLGSILQSSPGNCPVQLIITTEDGAEAVLAVQNGLRVEPSDTMLASLERLFGAAVAELR